jgi:hypothetical protein
MCKRVQGARALNQHMRVKTVANVVDGGVAGEEKWSRKEFKRKEKSTLRRGMQKLILQIKISRAVFKSTVNEGRSMHTAKRARTIAAERGAFAAAGGRAESGRRQADQTPAGF